MTLPRFLIGLAVLSTATAAMAQLRPGVPEGGQALKPGQPDAPPVPPPQFRPGGRGIFDFTLRDGTVVRGSLLAPGLSVATRYGRLIVPADEIRQVEFGLRYPAGVEARATAAMNRFRTPNPVERQIGERELTVLGDYALPTLRTAAFGPDRELAFRASALIQRIAPGITEARLRALDQDTFDSVEFPVRGQVEVDAFRVRRLFGEVTLRTEQIRSMKEVSFGPNPPPAPGITDFVLDAAKYAKPGWAAWYDTGVDVQATGPMEVKVSGKVDQWPREPNRWMTGPGGTATVAPGSPGNNRQFHSGVIVGRVGPTGEPFLIGPGYTATKSPGTGRLYVIIAPTPWGNDCTGNYTLQVKVGQ